jgi:hypothetical protein
MNNTQKNIATRMQQVALAQLGLAEDMKYISAMWATESMGSVPDVEIQELADFAGVTATEMLACKQAFDAVQTAVGDVSVAGTNAYKMLKLANVIP